MPVAMYQGDTRTRTLDIYVDDNLEYTWTSSGTTSEFENVKLGFSMTDSTTGGATYDYAHPGIAGSKVELVGVLGASEWLSILEVRCSVTLQQPVSVAALLLPAVTSKGI